MQVNSTTAVQPTSSTTARPRQSTSGTARAQSTPTTAQSAPAKAQSTPATAKAAVASTVQAAKAQTTNSASSIANQTYTTSVGGKSYSGNVQHSGGQYTVSVPNLPGATASGSSIQTAENALNVKIHILA